MMSHRARDKEEDEARPSKPETRVPYPAHMNYTRYTIRPQKKQQAQSNHLYTHTHHKARDPLSCHHYHQP